MEVGVQKNRIVRSLTPQEVQALKPESDRLQQLKRNHRELGRELEEQQRRVQRLVNLIADEDGQSIDMTAMAVTEPAPEEEVEDASTGE